jgi:hypothetical protein
MEKLGLELHLLRYYDLTPAEGTRSIIIIRNRKEKP